jgi:hypothetical protein
LVAVGVFLGSLNLVFGGNRPSWGLVAALVVADLLALRFPLHISVSVKVSMATAVWSGPRWP